MLDAVQELLRSGNGASLSARLAAVERRLAELPGAPGGDTIAAPPGVKGSPAGLQIVKVAGDGWQLQNSAGEAQSVLAPTGGAEHALLEKKSATTGDTDWTTSPTISGLLTILGSIFIQGEFRGFSNATEVPEGANGVVNFPTAGLIQELFPTGAGAAKISGFTIEGLQPPGGTLIILRNSPALVTATVELENEIGAAGTSAFALAAKAVLKLESRHARILYYKTEAPKRWVDVA